MNKTDLRIWAKTERSKLDISGISKKLAKNLINTKEYQQSKNIMVYYPLKNEVDLRLLFEDKTKNFYLPKVKDNELLCCPYKLEDKLYSSCFNTKEPFTEPIEIQNIDLIIIPALACDINNYRLGYGGGDYDRFLSNKKIKAKKIVCIPRELIVSTIYPEEFDIPVDKVITQ